MIPFDFNAPHVLWFNIWKSFVRAIHEFPSDPFMARKACEAQMRYVTYAAIEVVKNRKG